MYLLIINIYRYNTKQYSPLFDPVVLYCITSVTSFDSRATLILYLLSYDMGRPSLGDILSLVPFSITNKIYVHVNIKLKKGHYPSCPAIPHSDGPYSKLFR